MKSKFNSKFNKQGKQGKQGKNYKKKTIPKKIREQCWKNTFGEVYKHSCFVGWCDNEITVFDFHVGHDKPESDGGDLELSNLKPICARCNLSMSDTYTIQEWNNLSGERNQRQFCCFSMGSY